MITIPEQAEDLRQRMRHDMAVTLRVHLGDNFLITGPFLDELVNDGMFHVEHLLVEVGLISEQLLVTQQDLEKFQ